jgi:chromosome segregation ATPase
MGLSNLRSSPRGRPAVFHWYSPFPLEPALEEHLSTGGLRATADDTGASVDLLIYDTPDAVLDIWRQLDQPTPDNKELLEGYRSLARKRDGSRLISSWRLRQLKAHELLAWLRGETTCPTVPMPWPEVDALLAVVTRSVLEVEPDALEAYLDLELQSELAGTTPDSNYIHRLDSSASAEALQSRWSQAEQQTIKVKHLVEELAQLNREHDGLVKQKDAALHDADDLKQQLQSRLQELEAANQAIKEYREEAGLTLLQLHQVQEELENYFLRSREQDELTAQLQTKDQALGDAQAKCSDITNQLQQRNQELLSHQQRCDQLSKTQNDLTAQLQTKDQALQAVSAKCSDITNQLQQRNQELLTYQQRCDQLSKTQNDLAAQLQTKDQALQDAQAKFSDITNQLQQRNQELLSYQQRCDQLGKSQNDLAAQLQTKDQALQAASASTSEIRNQLHERSQELETANQSIKESREEAELTLLQLHQVQKELEHYFLRSRAGDELSHAQAQENSRAMGLLGRMIRLQATGL